MRVRRLLYKCFLRSQLYFRIVLWKFFFGSFGVRARVFGKIVVIQPENIFLGNNSTLNEGVFLNALTTITIGNNVHISPGCIINTGALEYEKKSDQRGHHSFPVTIEDGVWLASGVIVNPGVTIGAQSVVGAGAVVTHDIPKNSLAVGVPAKVIRNIHN